MTGYESDSGLIRRSKAGDLDAFEELVARYERRIYTMARRILRLDEDAEDVTQEAFMSALEHLGDFRHEGSFYAWVMRIATHGALKVLRRRKGINAVSLDAATDASDDFKSIPHPLYIADWRANPEALLEQKETKHLLDEALSELDEKYRIIFLLRDVEGLSVRETAELLGLSESNVKVRLLRARLQLRERLTRVFGDQAQQVFPGHVHG